MEMKGGFWSFIPDESDKWRYLISKSGCRLAWLHPKFQHDMFLYISYGKVIESDCTELVGCVSYKSKVKVLFDRLKTEHPISLVDGDWSSWEMDSNSTDRIVFSRNGNARLVLVKDCAYILGVRFPLLQKIKRLIY